MYLVINLGFLPCDLPAWCSSICSWTSFGNKLRQKGLHLVSMLTKHNEPVCILWPPSDYVYKAKNSWSLPSVLLGIVAKII